MPAGETRYIGLKFAAPPAVLGSAKLHVFVNNEEDKNEVRAQPSPLSLTTQRSPRTTKPSPRTTQPSPQPSPSPFRD